MAVSRTSVRNAINKLVTLGLLEHRQGQGTFVSSPETRNGNPLATFMNTYEATLDDLLEGTFYDFLFVGVKKNLTNMFMDRSALEEVKKTYNEKDRSFFDAIKEFFYRKVRRGG